MKDLDISKHWNDLDTITSYIDNHVNAVHAIIVQWAFGCKWPTEKYPDGTYCYRGYPIYKNKNIVKGKELLRYKWFAGYDSSENSFRIRANTLSDIKRIIDQQYFNYAYFMYREIMKNSDTREAAGFIVYLLTDTNQYPVYNIFDHIKNNCKP